MQLDLSTPQGLRSACCQRFCLSGWALVVLLVASWRHRPPKTAGWQGGSASRASSSAPPGWPRSG